MRKKVEKAVGGTYVFRKLGRREKTPLRDNVLPSGLDEHADTGEKAADVGWDRELSIDERQGVALKRC